MPPFKTKLPLFNIACFLTLEQLWCGVGWTSTEGVQFVPRYEFVAETEVRNLDVALYVEHNVVQLQVPVDHSVLVEEHDGDADFGSVESEDKRERKVEQSRVTSSAQLT